MNRYSCVLLFILIALLFTCQKDSPYIPESYKLLPKSDIPINLYDWHHSSIPVSSGKDLLLRSPLTWWNPYEKIAIKEIWSTIEVSPDVPNRIDVLDYYFEPNSEIVSSENCWGGIMLCTTEEFRNQFDSFQCFEITIKGDRGILHFDIGEISEDVIPNQQLNSEDIPISGLQNGILDQGEDVGLDGMLGADPGDWWDLNYDGIKGENEPISYDDWVYSTGSFDYERINGTENNGRLDTEDLNSNGLLDIQNNYYEYSINLDKSSPDTILIDPSLPTNGPYRWHTYRINLNNPTATIGNPNPFKPEFFRIWIEGVSSIAYIRIATIDFK